MVCDSITLAAQQLADQLGRCEYDERFYVAKPRAFPCYAWPRSSHAHPLCQRLAQWRACSEPHDGPIGADDEHVTVPSAEQSITVSCATAAHTTKTFSDPAYEYGVSFGAASANGGWWCSRILSNMYVPCWFEVRLSLVATLVPYILALFFYFAI